MINKKIMKKIIKELEKLKCFIVKEYEYVQFISVLPPQSINLFIKEEIIPKETEKHVHLFILVPDEQNISNITKIINQEIKNLKQKIYLQVRSLKYLWQFCFDKKHELFKAIAMSFPLYDNIILGAIKLAEIHKSLVLQRFEKNLISYVIDGSLVKGEAVKKSDVDVFIIIDDTDVKNMTRLEVLERARGIVFNYADKAFKISGAKNKLDPQIYLLTDFWNGVKIGTPVLYTSIRDGVPIYDTGNFMPLKVLLKKGKLIPSPEAIDMLITSSVDKLAEAKRSLIIIMINQIYWSVLSSSQALLMLYDLPPKGPKQTIIEMKKFFVDKEKMLQKKYIITFENIVKFFKDYQHGKIKEIKGKEIDIFIESSEEYLKKLKEIKVKIEKRTQKKIIEQIYQDIFELLETIVGKKSQDKIIEDFENNFVKKGMFSAKSLRTLKEITNTHFNLIKIKLDAYIMEELRKKAINLTNDLIKYNQRLEIIKKIR